MCLLTISLFQFKPGIAVFPDFGESVRSPIPDRFGEINESNETGLNNLIAFDVRDNSLAGPIPASLANLAAIQEIFS